MRERDRRRDARGGARGLAPWALGVLAVLLVAAPRAVWAQGAQEYQGRTIEKVEWEGLDRVSFHGLQSKIETREGNALDAGVLSKDVERLFRTGEFESENPHETPIRVEVMPANPANPGGPVKIIFHCRERPTVHEVRIDEAAYGPLKKSDAYDAVKTKVGGLYDSYRVALDARELRSKIVEKGYLYAEVAPVPTRVAGGVDIRFRVQPGPKVHVQELVFDGAQALDPSVVKDAEGPNALETKERKFFGLLESGVFDRRALRRDLDRVARYYRSQGYLDAKVYLDRYESSEDRTALTVHVRVEEGERYTVSGINVEGAHVISKEAILAELKMRPGRPLLGDDLHADIEKVKRMYGDRAYIHVEVDVDFHYDVARKLLDVTFRINEGPKVRIDRIRIEGNEKTREDVIRRELSFYPGEFFDATKFEESYSRVVKTHYFKDVRWDFEPGSEPGREDVVLKVEEQRTGQFTIGGGISTASGVFGNIALRQNNFDITAVPTSMRDVIDGHAFSGAGQIFAIQFQPGKDRSQYRVSFQEPWLFGRPIIFGVDGFIFQRDWGSEEWQENRVGGSVSLGYHFTPDLNGRITYTIQNVRIDSIGFAAVPDVVAVAGDNLESSIAFSVTYDRNVVEPRYFLLYKGYSISATYEIAGLGGDVHFGKVTVDANWQTTLLEFPTDHKWVLQLVGGFGYMNNYQDRETPIFERFFAGGPHTIRGFAYRGVGPMFFSKPLGGNVRLNGTAELSFPLFLHIVRGVVFLDACDLETSFHDVHAGGIRLAAGTGVRISLPIFPAPIALDFGWPILKQPGDKTQVFSFSVGVGF